MAIKKKSAEYTTKDIDSFEGLDHVRARPTTHLGEFPLSTGFREIVDNAFDEVDGGYADTVNIYIHDDNDYEVVDNGRGVPVDWDEKRGMNGIVLTLGRKESGQNFRAGSEGIAGNSGTNGVGASAVNAVSKRFDVESRRDGKAYRQSFSKGKPGNFSGNKFDPTASFKNTGNEPLTSRKAARGTTDGTSVRWSFDLDLLEGYDLDLQDVLRRAQYSTYLLPGSLLRIHDKDGNVHDYSGSNETPGTAQLLKELTNKPDREDIATLSGEGVFNINKKDTRGFSWEVSFAVNPEGNGRAWGFANRVYNIDGGKHVTAVQTAISKAINEKASSMRSIKRKKNESFEDADFAATMDVVVSVRGADIQMKGQEKAAVTSAPLGNEIRKQVLAEAEKFAKQRSNSAMVTEWGNAALRLVREKKSVEAAKKRARDKSIEKRFGAQVTKPEKLTDSRVNGPLAEIYIVEGDSAGGTSKGARNAEYQAIFPIRGKVLNAVAAEVDKIAKNTEITGLISAAGTGTYDDCDPKKSNYGKYIIATDADADGKHITVLVLSAFYKTMPALLREGYVYIAHSPLYSVRDESKGVVEFAYSYEELQEAKKKVFGRRQIPDHAIERFKGLGQMNANDFSAVMTPGTRRLTRVSIENAQRAFVSLTDEKSPMFDPEVVAFMNSIAGEATSWRKNVMNEFGISDINTNDVDIKEL